MSKLTGVDKLLAEAEQPPEPQILTKVKPEIRQKIIADLSKVLDAKLAGRPVPSERRLLQHITDTYHVKVSRAALIHAFKTLKNRRKQEGVQD